jgi:hypothetical protein
VRFKARRAIGISFSSGFAAILDKNWSTYRYPAERLFEKYAALIVPIRAGCLNDPFGSGTHS